MTWTWSVLSCICSCAFLNLATDGVLLPHASRLPVSQGRPLAGEGVSVAKGRQSAAAATGPGAGGAKQDALISNIGDERGRIQWQDDEMKRVNKAIFDAAPLPPGQPNEIPSFTGDWVCSTVSGDWDEFLYLLEVPEFQRKLAKSRKWGKGTAQQKIEMKEHKTMMSIGTCSPKLTFTVGGVQDSKPKDKKELPVMTSEIELAIDGKPQDLKFGDVQGKGTLQWEGSALIARLKVGVGGQEHSVCTSWLNSSHCIHFAAPLGRTTRSRAPTPRLLPALAVLYQANSAPRVYRWTGHGPRGSHAAREGVT
jgi:hypothetical protein